MSVDEKPVLTWNAEGKLVPMDASEAERQAKISRELEASRPKVQGPYIMGKLTLRRERWARFARNCRAFVSFNWPHVMEDMFAGVRGPRTLALVVITVIALLPLLALCYIFALCGIPFGHAMVRRIDAKR
jgi:hypothetical protein